MTHIHRYPELLCAAGKYIQFIELTEMDVYSHIIHIMDYLYTHVLHMENDDIIYRNKVFHSFHRP